MMFVLQKDYCITGNMQKISSIHTLIQQILGPHELVTPIFGHTHPEISEITFSFSQSPPALKKSVHYQFILEILSILESCDQTGHTHF